MPAAAKDEMLASANTEEIFSLAAGVAAALDTRECANAVRGRKPHQGIFSKNRRPRINPTWVKWSGTHQDRSLAWSETVLGPTVYLYDGNNPVEELDGGGNVSARYTEGAHVDEWLAELRSGTISYYQQDGLGSVTSLSNSGGALANTYAYDSYGKLIASTGTLTNPFQYAGRELDSETGTYYYRARYYDPAAGRFLSEDPMRFGEGTDFYPYVGNNPVTMADPLGLQHTPGGPWHPDPWIKYGCLGTDDCATLSWKIALFKKILAEHYAWDAANGPGTHTDNFDIPNHENGLRNCIELHQEKCTNNKCPPLIPAPEPETEPIRIPAPPPVVTFGIGGTLILILIIALSPVGV